MMANNISHIAHRLVHTVRHSQTQRQCRGASPVGQKTQAQSLTDRPRKPLYCYNVSERNFNTSHLYLHHTVHIALCAELTLCDTTRHIIGTFFFFFAILCWCMLVLLLLPQVWTWVSRMRSSHLSTSSTKARWDDDAAQSNWVPLSHWWVPPTSVPALYNYANHGGGGNDLNYIDTE